MNMCVWVWVCEYTNENVSVTKVSKQEPTYQIHFTEQSCSLFLNMSTTAFLLLTAEQTGSNRDNCLHRLNVYKMAPLKKSLLIPDLDSNFLWAGSRMSRLFKLAWVIFFYEKKMENFQNVETSLVVNIYLDPIENCYRTVPATCLPIFSLFF